MSNRASSADLEELLQEYATDPDYRNIPEMTPQHLKSHLMKHQKQMIYWMLKTEAAGPILNDKGEMFYSRIGLQCSPTGIGKTALALGVCCYDVGEPVINDVILTTSLNTILLKPKLLPVIQCTVICTDTKIIDNAWMRDLNLFYNQNLSYYRFDTVGAFEASVKNTPEYLAKTTYVQQIGDFMYRWLQALRDGHVTQDQFEVALLPYGAIKDENDIIEHLTKLNEEITDFFDTLIVRELYRIMSSVKIFFVTIQSFFYLFKLFKHYRVARLMLDEIQGVTIINQKFFEDMEKDPRILKMRSLGLGKMKPYAEQSPFLFIWTISATAELINDNVGDHYFNAWIYKNDFLITDYSTNFEDKRMFPEMTKQYVVKMPYSYCLESRPDLAFLFKEYKLKAKKSAVAAILTGVLGDEFDQLLENDDLEGIIAKLNNNGSVNTLLQDAQRSLEKEIHKHEQRIAMYDQNTPKHVVTKSKEELGKEKKNLEDLKKKIDRFHGQHTAGTSEECPICLEDLQVVPSQGMDPRKVCVAHMSCMNIFHMGCIGDYMRADNNAVCPNCRGELSEENLKPTYDVNGYNISQQVQVQDMQPKQQTFAIDTEKEYDNKSDALKAALGPMERITNGQSAWYRRQRVLLFLELKGEDNGKLDEIVKNCQDFGYNVMLPFKVGTKAAMASRFPVRNGCEVTQKGKDINTDQNTFMTNRGAVVWIFRSIKDAAGLNFPGADTLIMYSNFKHKVQIVGRVKRFTRVIPCDIFTITNV